MKLESNYLITSFENGIAKIALNRPEVYNALSPELLNEIAQAFAAFGEREDVKVIVLKGEGRGFCSGQDIKMIQKLGQFKASQIIEEFYKPAILSIAENAKPVICQLHGSATGAGMALALSCDIIVAVESASLNAGFSKIGLMPDSGATYFLLQQLGEKLTLELLAFGGVLSASEAHNLKLINKVTTEAELEDMTLNMASQLLSAAPLVVKMLKKLIKESQGKSLSDVIFLESKYQDLAANSADFKEGITAFLEKRKPSFKGF